MKKDMCFSDFTNLYFRGRCRYLYREECYGGVCSRRERSCSPGSRGFPAGSHIFSGTIQARKVERGEEWPKQRKCMTEGPETKTCKKALSLKVVQSGQIC